VSQVCAGEFHALRRSDFHFVQLRNSAENHFVNIVVEYATRNVHDSSDRKDIKESTDT
jgi:hypothetical protein